MYGNADIKRKLLKMKILEKSMLKKRISDLKKEIDELEKEIFVSENWQAKKEIFGD